MTVITYSRYSGTDAAAQLDDFVPAYEEIYVEPPYREGPHDVAEFIEHYAVQARARARSWLVSRTATTSPPVPDGGPTSRTRN
ncbi:hypothetical protein [Streptomyces sp. NBC_00647]|uniref:hypothetical protein n=1 Tax=Streptomyces sp. NBC_00647 TaxID=2975796 RepID=UPI00386E1855